jgi:hypothetical protein
MQSYVKSTCKPRSLWRKRDWFFIALTLGTLAVCAVLGGCAHQPSAPFTPSYAPVLTYVR